MVLGTPTVALELLCDDPIELDVTEDELRLDDLVAVDELELELATDEVVALEEAALLLAMPLVYISGNKGLP
jgi:hypothetical protein